jgi:uncharacterized protein (UPF0276 family)
MPWVGLSLMPEPDFATTAHPLLKAGEVDVLEWSFDVGWATPPPGWAVALIDHFSANRRLLGHGVTYSALSAEWTARQAGWLKRLEAEVATRAYRHVSEHFGFMTAGTFHDGTPLPVPRTAAALEVGRDRLKRLAASAAAPVGLENLAFAFGPEDMRQQGAFLEDLLAPVDGFLVLDLPNLHCQSRNFGVPAEALLDGYPLARVREMHVSGGSWSEGVGGPVRRDTHDEAVPEELFGLLEEALRRCPRTEAVIFERLGTTLGTEEARRGVHADYRRVRAIAGAARG